MTEAPGLVIVYLALFCRHEDWDDLPALAKYLNGFAKNILPNMRIVELTIEKYRKFQEEQRKKRLVEEEERRRREAE